jgi:hypothetical protein
VKQVKLFLYVFVIGILAWISACSHQEVVTKEFPPLEEDYMGGEGKWRGFHTKNMMH